MNIIIPPLAEYTARLAQSTIHKGKRPASKSAHPLVSIITPTFNYGHTLGRTIQSVAHQTYPNIEYIIVDGGSTDTTAAVIAKNISHISRWVSEKDHGMADAYNKGLAMAKGEFIQFINADDYLGADQIANAVKALQNATTAGFVCGDTEMVHPDNTPGYMVFGRPDFLRTMPWHFTVSFPSCMFRGAVFAQIGIFTTQKYFRSSWDYEWHARAATAGIRGVYTSTILVHMQTGGFSGKLLHEQFQSSFTINTTYYPYHPMAWLGLPIKYTKYALRRGLEAFGANSTIWHLRKLFNPAYVGSQR